MDAHRSILFLDPPGDEAAGDAVAGDASERDGRPDFFGDLNLDQVVDAVTAGYDQYKLDALFCRPLHSADAVVFRQEVARDLEDASLFRRVSAFAEAMRSIRSEVRLSAATRNVHQGQRWFAHAAGAYIETVSGLARDLSAASIASRGLVSVRDHVTGYVVSPEFAALKEDLRAVLAELDRIRYRMDVSGVKVTASRYEGEADYSADVLATFERFKQGEAGDHRSIHPTSERLTHFEDRVLNLVVRLYPQVFASLAAFAESHRDFIDPAVARFDREVHFYLSYLDYLTPLRAAGLPFCYPTVGADSKRVDVVQAFDLALASKLVEEGSPVVCNDVSLKGKERILVVTGPNQGGKTTFARMFGQLHYLASLGLPVPGTRARLVLFDEMFTHFEKEEDLSTLVGKLEDDLVRIRDILTRATPASIIILNEMFTSTTLEDAVFLGTNVLERIIALDARCVCVTFIDEFASLSSSTVSMMSTVEEDDATRRTLVIVRKPADGLAYADAIAQKYHLGYARLKERLRS
jgi:DNA mismatch repair protein MutS